MHYSENYWKTIKLKEVQDIIVCCEVYGWKHSLPSPKAVVGETLGVNISVLNNRDGANMQVKNITVDGN